MDTLLSGDLKVLLMVAGGLILLIVAVMSLLLPILVFRIMREIDEMNKKLSRIATLLAELNREGGEVQGGGLRAGDEPARRGNGPSRSESRDIGDKPIRFE